MIRKPTALEEVLLFETQVHQDERGLFLETWREQAYREAGIQAVFVQDNVSVSEQNVLRGFHFQTPRPQGKLVTVLYGEAYDVAVDIRRGSPTFMEWTALTLSAERGSQLYIPPGFAHGFVAVSDRAVLSYKCTEYYDPSGDFCIRWDDPLIGVDWPLSCPILSGKDASAPTMAEISAEALPTY